MPPSSPAIVDRILEYTAVAANALQDVATASQIPFLSRVCTITLSIIPMVQNARFQREQYLRIVEGIHHSLCALTSLSIHSDIQAPKMLEQIAQYASTLQKLDSCLRSQPELGTFKHLFKQGEITVRLDSCETELRAFTVFKGPLDSVCLKTSPLGFLNHLMHARVGSGVAETDPSIQGHVLKTTPERRFHPRVSTLPHCRSYCVFTGTNTPVRPPFSKIVKEAKQLRKAAELPFEGFDVLASPPVYGLLSLALENQHLVSTASPEFAAKAESMDQLEADLAVKLATACLGSGKKAAGVSRFQKYQVIGHGLRATIASHGRRVEGPLLALISAIRFFVI
ncbi:hypothetical protein B0H14DRAFT_2645890 [Mycena olivaceomarginata]|nr:hypothetical protein B0H14DRAFT_2645890 [Mycena olivaceomarginata]